MLAGAGSVENALAHNTSGVVIPWIALGCGYRREFDPAVWETFDFGWNYDYYYSWMLGRELNGEWFAARPVRIQHFSICPPPAFRFFRLIRSTANCIIIAQFPIENHSEQGQFSELPLKTIGKSVKFGRILCNSQYNASVS